MICFLLHFSPSPQTCASHTCGPSSSTQIISLSYLISYVFSSSILISSFFSLLLFLVLILLLLHMCAHTYVHTPHTLGMRVKLHLAYFASHNILSTFIHSPVNVTNQVFFTDKQNFMYHILFIHSAVDGHQWLISFLSCSE